MSKFDEATRERLLKGEITLQTKEECLEYRKIPPEIKIKGLEEMAVTMNKLESCMSGKIVRERGPGMEGDKAAGKKHKK